MSQIYFASRKKGVSFEDSHTFVNGIEEVLARLDIVKTKQSRSHFPSGFVHEYRDGKLILTHASLLHNTTGKVRPILPHFNLFTACGDNEGAVKVAMNAVKRYSHSHGYEEVREIFDYITLH